MQAILVVLAEAARLRYTETVLLRAGYHVLAAESGDAALSACQQGAEPLDLFVMDFTMEQSHGGILRGMYPGVPILVLADLGSGDILDRVRQTLIRPPTENA